MYRKCSQIIFVFLLLFSSVCVLWAKPGREFHAADIRDGMEKGDKFAILMVHFGSAYPEARTEILDVMNNHVKRAFPNVEVRQAYSARSVVARLRAQGIWVQLPVNALIELRDHGFTHVIVQPTIIIEGVEMEAIRQEIEKMKGLFKDLRVGNPLLYDDRDYEEVIKALSIASISNVSANLLVAHGTYHASNSAYAKLGYMFKLKGKANYYIGTREGFPTLDDVTLEMQVAGKRDVCLIPFMFVLVKGKKNEVVTYWKQQLENRGFNVSINGRSLGQYSAIRELFIEHIRFAMKYKRISVLDRKRLFAHL